MSSADQLTTYSIIIPAFNEEALLGATLASVKRCMGKEIATRGELVVVDNNSTDATASLACIIHEATVETK